MRFRTLEAFGRSGVTERDDQGEKEEVSLETTVYPAIVLTLFTSMMAAT